MQLVVDRHEHPLRGPDREHQLDDLRAVLAGDRDACAGGPSPRDRAGQPQRPIPQLGPRTALAFTEIHRAAVAEASGGLVEQCEQVQRATHSDVSAKSDRYFVELQPPSTTIVWPLMKLPPSEHRNATVLAMSSTLPSRWMRRHLGVDLAEPLVLQPLRHHRGQRDARRHGVAADSLRAVLAGDVRGQRRQPTLGRRVGAAAQAADDGERRRDVDDRRSRLHVRDHVARQPERRPQHQTQEIVQGFVVGLVQRLGAADTGVVDQEVDVPPSLTRPGPRSVAARRRRSDRRRWSRPDRRRRWPSPSRPACPRRGPVPTTAMPISASLVAQPKPMPLLAPVTIATCMSHHPPSSASPGSDASAPCPRRSSAARPRSPPAQEL